jgi:hypothetical protein
MVVGRNSTPNVLPLIDRSSSRTCVPEATRRGVESDARETKGRRFLMSSEAIPRELSA